MLNDAETARSRAVSVMLVGYGLGLGVPAFATDAIVPQLNYIASSKVYDRRSGFLEPSGLSWDEGETVLVSVTTRRSSTLGLPWLLGKNG